MTNHPTDVRPDRPPDRPIDALFLANATGGRSLENGSSASGVLH